MSPALRLLPRPRYPVVYCGRVTWRLNGYRRLSMALNGSRRGHGGVSMDINGSQRLSPTLGGSQRLSTALNGSTALGGDSTLPGWCLLGLSIVPRRPATIPASTGKGAEACRCTSNDRRKASSGKTSCSHAGASMSRIGRCLSLYMSPPVLRWQSAVAVAVARCCLRPASGHCCIYCAYTVWQSTHLRGEGVGVFEYFSSVICHFCFESPPSL